MQTLRLALRLARWDRAATVGVAASAALLSLMFAAALIVNVTYVRTIADGVTSDNGGLAYRLEVVDNSAGITADLSERPEWVPVWTTTVQARAGSRLVPARASSVRPSAAIDGFGDLVTGHAPHRADEASVSRVLAEGLALEVGDTVTIAGDGGPAAEVTVTGVYVNSTRPDDVSMYRRVATPPATPPDFWLSDVAPADDSRLMAAYDRGQVKFRSTRGSVSDQQEQATAGVMAPLRYLPHFFAAMALILLTAILAAFRIRVRRVIHGLAAAGMQAGPSRQVPILAATAVVLTGIAGGYAVATAGTLLARRPLGAMLGQYWPTITVPWGWLAGLMVGLPALLYVLFTLGTAGRRRTGTPALAGGSRARLAVVVLAVVLGFVLEGRADGRSTGGVSAALYGGLLLAVALPALLLSTSALRRSSVTARTVRTFGLSIGGTAIVVSAMLFLTSFFGVRLAATAAEAGPPEQPRGSLVIDGLSDSDATTVEAAYRRFSRGQVWRLPLPQETTTSLRVATPTFVSCVGALPRPSLDLAGDCPTGVSLTPLNRTAITGPGTVEPGPLPPHTVVADPQLIEHGQVGLLVISATGDAQQVERAVVVDARPLPGLGGNLPGAIVDPADHVVAQDLGRSHVSVLVLHDFAELSPSDKAEVRGAIATAGLAQVSEDQGTAQGEGRVLALMIMATGALIALLLLLAAAAALTTAQADFRDLLSQLGIPAYRRFAVGLRILTIPFVAALLSAAIAAFASSRVGSDSLSEPALLLVPASCALAGVLLCAVLYARNTQNRHS